ncbi:hypothetical protein B484DRAFT_451355 [Ochromonadaceae sp. CCMP2298]|nr:hypothetical protein B484DRAFT_451355 [Ochromonadaceae sp. CCMP2298]
MVAMAAIALLLVVCCAVEGLAPDLLGQGAGKLLVGQERATFIKTPHHIKLLGEELTELAEGVDTFQSGMMQLLVGTVPWHRGQGQRQGQGQGQGELASQSMLNSLQSTTSGKPTPEAVRLSLVPFPAPFPSPARASTSASVSASAPASASASASVPGSRRGVWAWVRRLLPSNSTNSNSNSRSSRGGGSGGEGTLSGQAGQGQGGRWRWFGIVTGLFAPRSASAAVPLIRQGQGQLPVQLQVVGPGLKDPTPKVAVGSRNMPLWVQGGMGQRAGATGQGEQMGRGQRGLGLEAWQGKGGQGHEGEESLLSYLQALPSAVAQLSQLASPRARLKSQTLQKPQNPWAHSYSPYRAGSGTGVGAGGAGGVRGAGGTGGVVVGVTGGAGAVRGVAGDLPARSINRSFQTKVSRLLNNDRRKILTFQRATDGFRSEGISSNAYIIALEGLFGASLLGTVVGPLVLEIPEKETARSLKAAYDRFVVAQAQKQRGREGGVAGVGGGSKGGGGGGRAGFKWSSLTLRLFGTGEGAQGQLQGMHGVQVQGGQTQAQKKQAQQAQVRAQAQVQAQAQGRLKLPLNIPPNRRLSVQRHMTSLAAGGCPVEFFAHLTRELGNSRAVAALPEVLVQLSPDGALALRAASRGGA